MNNIFFVFNTIKKSFPIVFLFGNSIFYSETTDNLLYPKDQESLGQKACYLKRILDKKEIELEGFKNKPKVCVLSSAPAKKDKPPLVISASFEGQERYTKPPAADAPAVLLMYGWEGAPGGINLSYNLDSVDYSIQYFILDAGKKPINLLQAQWPGASLEQDKIKFESDAIPKAEYLNTDLYYVALLKELKKQHNKLHLVCHSNGGLKLLSAYLSMQKEERDGISLSLLDPFFPSESPQFRATSFGYLLEYYIKAMNWLIPTYKSDPYDWITYPITIFGDAFLKTINWIKMKVLINFNNKDMMHMILRCFEDEKRLFDLLEKTEDHSLDIRQIRILTNPGGFGSRGSYKDLLQNKLVPKINKDLNGAELEIDGCNYGHNDFLGTPAFWDWVEKGIQNNSNHDQDKGGDSEWELV